jgi:hypothetical protein
MKRIYNWSEIQRYHDEGHGFVEAAKKFGFTHTAWIKAIKRGEIKAAARPFRDRRRRHDWAKIQAYVDAGLTYRECLIRFNINDHTWRAAVKRGELRVAPRVRAIPLEIMISNRMSRGSIKRRLIEMGLFEERCSRCGIEEWRGKELTIHIDHINGVNDDWRLENLRMLCPNCHSQTPTFSGRNLRNLSRFLTGGAL